MVFQGSCMVLRAGLDCKEGRVPKTWCLQTVVWRRLLSLGQWEDQASQSWGRSTLNSKRDCCWSWSSSILVIWWEQSTYWKSPWCWERLRAEGEEGIRGWDGSIAYQCNGHELGQTSGDGEGQGGLACCSPLDNKESDMNGRLNNRGEEWHPDFLCLEHWSAYNFSFGPKLYNYGYIHGSKN